MQTPTQTETLVTYDDGVERPAHSTKGASGAERWMNCPGSSALIEGMELPQSDEYDYRREGTAMHEAAADCLARDCDAWEVTGETYHETEITASMGDAIQMYLDRVRPFIDRAKFHREQFFIEAKLAAPEVHAQMFGSVDFAALVGPKVLKDGPAAAVCGGFLDVTDFKGGEGIEVEAYDNPQMKYYAFMLINTRFNELDDDFPVRLTIVQPRCFSYEGPIREWWTTVGEIKSWVVRDLLPAMNSTDDALSAGDWCRFCPAKLVCPLLTGLFKAAAMYDPKAVVNVSDDAMGLAYDKIQAVKFYLKALEEEAFRRLSHGAKLPLVKLVNKKANRIFKETCTVQVEGKDTEVPLLDEVKRRFGANAFTAPELKSPAELSKVPGAKEFVEEYAYMPVTGLTVAREDDRRTGIVVAKAEVRFAAAIENLTNGD